MKSVTILSDSTCDLSAELLEKYHIATIPLHIHLGEKEYLDGVDITPEEIYNWSDENKVTPKTSTVSPYEAKKFLQEHLTEENELICFCISENISSCRSIMHMVALDLGVADRVYILDSANLSTGIGLQIIEAAIMAKQGMGAKQIVDRIKEIQPSIRASFVIDTLTYLYRGGRCGGLTALVGSTLKLHPCISVMNGKMQVGKKYRGEMKNTIKSYVRDLKPVLEMARPERVFITHSGCDTTLIDIVRKQLEELQHFDEILITRAGSVISSHCGPGTLGILFIAGENKTSY